MTDAQTTGAQTTDAQGGGWPPNPWLSMWTRPRGTIRRILNADPHRRIFVLAALIGLTRFFGNADERPLDGDMPLTMAVPIALVLAPLAGLLLLYIWGALTWLAGRWIGGTAGAFQLRAAIAWSHMPLIWALALEPLRLLILGPENFFAGGAAAEAGPGAALAYSAYILAMLAAALWTLVLTVRSVAEAQGFASSWKGLGNLVLAGLVLLIPIALLALLIGLLTGAL